MSKITKIVKSAVNIAGGGRGRIQVPTYSQPVRIATPGAINVPVPSSNAASEFEYVVIAPSRNSVNVLTKTGEVTMTSPMDRSAFKDIVESIGLLGPNPNVETVDCKGIAESILDHFERWYPGVKRDGCKSEDIVELMREMMMYAVRNHPMVMASPVTGPEVTSTIFNNIMERVENS